MFYSRLFWHILVLLFVAVLNTDQKQVGEENVYLVYSSQRSVREAKAGTEAETMKGSCLFPLACSRTFPTKPRPTCPWLAPPTGEWPLPHHPVIKSLQLYFLLSNFFRLFFICFHSSLSFKATHVGEDVELNSSVVLVGTGTVQSLWKTFAGLQNKQTSYHLIQKTYQRVYTREFKVETWNIYTPTLTVL